MIVFRSMLEFLQDKEYRELLIATFIVMIIGSIGFHILEGWSFIDSLYFSVVTLTTVGYGDLSPKTDAGKLFTIVYIIMGIGIILAFVNAIYHHYYNLINRSSIMINKGDNKQENEETN